MKNGTKKMLEQLRTINHNELDPSSLEYNIDTINQCRYYLTELLQLQPEPSQLREIADLLELVSHKIKISVKHGIGFVGLHPLELSDLTKKVLAVFDLLTSTNEKGN